MSVDQFMRARIRRMFYVDHLSIHGIASQLGIHHSAVRRATGNETRSLPKQCQSIVQPYENLVREKLTQYPKITSTRMFLILKEHGFQGSASSVRRFVHKMRPTIARAFVRIETLPGEEAQVDWAHLGKVTIGQAKRNLYLFAMILSWSRAIYMRLCFDMTVETLLRCHTLAFEYYNGIPKRILYDNMKTVVLDRYEDSIRYHPAFHEYSAHYCFEPRVCDPYQPNQKGKVERAIRYARTSFLVGRDLSQLTHQSLDQWLLEVTFNRPWQGDSSKTVKEVFEQEQAMLLKSTSRLWPLAEKIVRSNKTPWIRYDLNHYSIPIAFVRQPLTLRADENTVFLYNDGEEIAAHTRVWQRDQWVRDDLHFKDIKGKGQKLALSRRFLEQEVAGVSDLFAECLKLEITSHKLQKTLEFILYDHSHKILAEVVKIALERQTPRPESLIHIANQLTDKSSKNHLPIKLPNRQGVQELSVTSHDLSTYDQL